MIPSWFTKTAKFAAVRQQRGLFLGRSPDAAVHHHSLTNETFTLSAVWRPRQEMNLALDCNLMQRRNPCTGTKLPTFCGWRTSHHQTRVETWTSEVM